MNSVVQHNGKNFRASNVDRVLATMRASKGATLYEIADLANVSVPYVRNIIDYVDEVKKLILKGNIAPSEAGPLPKWAKDSKGNPLKIIRVPSTELMVSSNFNNLPVKLRQEIKDEIEDTTTLVASLARRSALSPKSQRKKVAEVSARLIHTAEREEQNMRYIEESVQRSAEDEARIKTLEHLVKVLDTVNTKTAQLVPA